MAGTYTRSEQSVGLTLGQVLLAFVVLGSLLRILAARGDFWLDEILSLQVASAASSMAEIFTNYTDNNHLLNSLWIYALGGNQSFYAYRLLSVITGILGLLVIPGLPLFRSNSERTVAVLLWSASYYTVLYGTEARGYGPMLFFGLCALKLALGEIPRSRAGGLVRALAYFSACALGVLSHATFVNFYAALVLGPLAAQFFWPAAGQRLGGILRLNLAPACFMAVMYYLFISRIPKGSGTLRSFMEVILNAASSA